MKYSHFEDLPVWNAEVEFALAVFEFIEKHDGPFRGLGDVRNQLQRAAVSVSNNIAEGFERGTTAELVNFLYIAKGSSGESRSMLCLCERAARFANLKSEISNLKLRAEGVAKQLSGWLGSLKNSPIKGQKFLNDTERSRLKRIREDKEFKELLQRVMRGEKIDWENLD